MASAAATAAPSSRGEATAAAGTSPASKPRPARCDSGNAAGDGPLEQKVAEEEQRRPAEHGRRGRDFRAPGRMGQHQLVGDRGDDDAGHDQKVEVGVGRGGPDRPGRPMS